jgi:hypothetical protein
MNQLENQRCVREFNFRNRGLVVALRMELPANAGCPEHQRLEGSGHNEATITGFERGRDSPEIQAWGKLDSYATDAFVAPDGHPSNRGSPLQ